MKPNMTPEGNRLYNSRNDLIDKLIHMRINECKTRLDIYAYLTKDLGFADSTAYTYMKDAREETDRRAVQNFGEDLKEDIERWERLLAECELVGDRKGIRDCLKEISTLKGHYVERMDITSNGNQIIGEIKLVKATGKGKKKDDDIDKLFDGI